MFKLSQFINRNYRSCRTKNWVQCLFVSACFRKLLILAVQVYNGVKTVCCKQLPHVKPGPHPQQCRSNIVQCYNVEWCFDNVAVFGNNVEATFDFVAKNGNKCRTSFALKFRPFDKVERCFDIVASVDRALLNFIKTFTRKKQ